MVSPVVNLTDVHVTEGGHNCFRLKANIPEANLTVSALNSRASYWMGSLRREASHFEDGERPIFYGHARKVGKV